MKFTKLWIYGQMALVSFVLWGCSVGMALHGEKEVDVSTLRQGLTRYEVEIRLGQPKKVEKLSNGNEYSIYEYTVGNEPSAGRAVAHGVMDVLTLGLWEVIGTPVEIVNGDKFQIAVEYDKDEKVVNLKKSHKNSPLPTSS